MMKIAIRPVDRVFIFLTGAVVIIAIILLALLAGTAKVERQPMVAYLANPLEAPEVWLASTDGSDSHPLTATRGRVYDFAVAPDGEQVLYSVMNEAGGSDLFRIDREGTNPVMLVDCGDHHCIQAAWQPEGQIIAYSQYKKGMELDSRINWIDGESGESLNILDGLNPEGAFPVFSPDGQSLAYFSFADSSIHVLSLTTGIESRVSSQNPDTPVWSDDGKLIYFTDMVTRGEVLQARLFQLIVENSKVELFMPAELTGYDASKIDWSPDGEWAILGLKTLNSQSRRQIFIVRKDGSELQAVTADPNSSHSAYHWSPFGGQIIFQVYTFGALNANPKIVLWDLATGRFTEIAENGALPVWLP
ncbi:MAG: TolB family protein [Bellilinea sp.]